MAHFKLKLKSAKKWQEKIFPRSDKLLLKATKDFCWRKQLRFAAQNNTKTHIEACKNTDMDNSHAAQLPYK